MACETDPLLSHQTSQCPSEEENQLKLPCQQNASFSHLASILFPMCIGFFLAAMDGTLVMSSYATIGSDLHELRKSSWITTGYMITVTSFQPLYGKLSDIFGRKSCLLFAYVVFTLGSLLCGLARTMNELIAARALTGIGAGGMTTVVTITLSDVVPMRYRGTWQGIINIIFATGSATGAPLGGILSDSIGWRWAFLIQVPAAIFAIISVALALKLPKQKEPALTEKLQRVDFAGAAALIAMTFALLTGLDRGSNVSWDDPYTIASLTMSLTLLLLFTLIEVKWAKEPFAPKHVVFNSSLMASYLCNFFGLGAMVTLIFEISLYFQAVLRKTSFEAGLCLLPGIVAGVSGSLIGGLTMQVTGKYYLITIASYALLFFGHGAVYTLTGHVNAPIIGLIMGMIMAHFGNGIGITTTLIALVSNAGPEDQAIVTAVSFLFRSLGTVVTLSMGSSITQYTLRGHLRASLSGENAEEIIHEVRKSLDIIKSLDPATREIVRASYRKAIQTTLSFLTSVAACSALSSFYVKERPLDARKS